MSKFEENEKRISGLFERRAKALEYLKNETRTIALEIARLRFLWMREQPNLDMVQFQFNAGWVALNQTHLKPDDYLPKLGIEGTVRDTLFRFAVVYNWNTCCAESFEHKQRASGEVPRICNRGSFSIDEVEVATRHVIEMFGDDMPNFDFQRSLMTGERAIPPSLYPKKHSGSSPA